MARMKLTKSVVDNIPFSTGGQRLYLDTELKGFGLMVGSQAKAYIAQKDIRGRTRRITIGRHGTWTVEMARREAQQLLMAMDRGLDPVQTQREAQAQLVTLAEGMTIHMEKVRRKGRASRTLELYHHNLGKHLKDWLNRPMQQLTRTEVRQRHSEIGQRSGPYAANRTMKSLRAVFNTMMQENESIPSSPTIAVHWYKEYRRQEPVTEEKLPGWYQTVLSISNPVRRDLQLFTLFTGMRRTDVASIRWEDFDKAKGSLHRPNPKGGKERAFTVPLPDICLEILQRRKAENAPFFGADCPWVFPSLNRAGELTYVVMPYEKRKGLPTPHRLRDTYTTAANAAGLSPYDIDVLTNHRPPMGAVTAGYIRQDFEYLRVQQQRVADYLKLKIGMSAETGTEPPANNVYYIHPTRNVRARIDANSKESRTKKV